MDEHRRRTSRAHKQSVACPDEGHIPGAFAARPPAFEKLAFAGIKLKNEVCARVAHQELTVVLHRHLREMPWSSGRRDHIRDKLVGWCATRCSHDSDSCVGVKSGVLAAVPKIDEVGRRIVQQAIRARLDFERLNRSKAFPFEYPHGPVQTRYIQFVELTAQ